MPQNWLPGDIRDRIRDLCRVKNLKQSELAHAIGIDKSTLSRFMSGKTDKLSDTSLQKIAQRLNVSTDFLLGNTDIPDRKHYDIGELGLTVQAARNLYTHKVDPAIVCELLEHPRFGELTRLLSSYKDELFASGVAAQNQMLSSLGGLVLAQGRASKDDMSRRNPHGAITKNARRMSAVMNTIRNGSICRRRIPSESKQPLQNCPCGRMPGSACATASVTMPPCPMQRLHAATT